MQANGERDCIIKMIKPDYYDTIRDIRNVLEEFLPFFPKDCCDDASHMIYRICHYKYEISEVAGYYLRPDNKELFHALGYCEPKREYIDITIRQFSKRFPEILIVSKDNFKRFREDANATKQHSDIMLTTRAQERMNWLLEKFIERYPEKRDQIIM